MNRKNFNLIHAGLVAGLLTATAGFSAEANATAGKATDKITQLFGDDTIAKGTGLEIKRSQLDASMISIRANAAARNQAITPDQAVMYERQILERLIQIQLLNNKATEADKAKGKELSAKQYDLVLKRSGSDEALARQLKSIGMSMEELKAKMTEEAIAQAVADRELKVAVTDEEAKKFYDENPAKFERPEMIRASHILLTTLDPDTRQTLPEDKKATKRKQIEELLKRARAGEDFAKLARENTEDPGSRDTGGEYTFPRGQMAPEFEAAAFSLNTNQVSDVITTQFGFHIIKLSEKIHAQKVELAKVADDLKEGLKRQKLEKLLPDYIEKMEKDANVEILDAKIKAADELLKAANKPATAPVKQVEDKKADEKK